MDESSSPERQEVETLPAPVPLRLLAFLMDFILLIFLSTLILLYLPKMLGEQTEREFDDLRARFGMLILNPENQDSMAARQLTEQTSEFLARINYKLINTLAFILYFLACEARFDGRSLGKAVFSLRTTSLTGSPTPSFSQILYRSLIKGLSCSWAMLGLANLLCFLINRNKRCLHDLASKTTTTQAGAKPSAPSQDSP